MTRDEAARLLASFRGVRIAVLGDVMLDEYVWGDVARISPDAPVQIVDILRRSHAVGGAANVARNVQVAGGAASCFGTVGDDPEGAALVRLLAEAGIDADAVVAVDDRPTTLKTRVVARGQQVLRLDRERRAPLRPKDRDRLLARLEAALPDCGAVLVSDYGKGVLDRDVVARVAKRIREGGRAIPLLVDPKAVDFSVYRGCDVVTPNRKEAEAATQVSLQTTDDVREAARRMRSACGASTVIITLGERGLAVCASDDSVETIPAQARDVFDVTGAGDTVLAYLGLALASGSSPIAAADLANAAAGVSVGKVGANPVTPDEVLAAIAGATEPVKTASPEEAERRVERERSLGRRIVFTNGCFDLLHAGHVHLLQRARSFGDVLVVGVNSDASVRRLKGEGRPVMVESDRTRVLAALDAVDLVVVFDDDTPQSLIDRLRPDVLVKGGDYTVETIVGAAGVLARGGRVETVPLMAGLSTTSLVDALKGKTRR